VVSDVPVDVDDGRQWWLQESPYLPGAQSFGGIHRGRVCVHVFIRVTGWVCVRVVSICVVLYNSKKRYWGWAIAFIPSTKKGYWGRERNAVISEYLKDSSFYFLLVFSCLTSTKFHVICRLQLTFLYSHAVLSIQLSFSKRIAELLQMKSLWCA
jgi:hypothetical protein